MDAVQEHLLLVPNVRKIEVIIDALQVNTTEELCSEVARLLVDMDEYHNRTLKKNIVVWVPVETGSELRIWNAAGEESLLFDEI